MSLLSVSDFINQSANSLVLDARSEKEFEHAHFPGAVNIPLLNNEHRHLVGIEYKQKGREAAVELGFKLVGPKFHEFISTANELAKDRKEVFVYCWRGGMRSSIMAWILGMAGFRQHLLKGGYKAYRSWVLDELKKKKKIAVVGGHTGCGKTEILHELKRLGEQVVDLESIAHHKGSAFGSLGELPQPSNEQFENILGLQWNRIDENQTVWLEAESRSIGTVKIPDSIFDQLQSSPLVEVLSPRERRMKRILDVYGKFSKEELGECTAKIRKRLGNLRLTEALTALEEGRMNDWLEILLDYYDKTYSHSLGERQPSERISLEVSNDESSGQIAARLTKLFPKVNLEKAV